MAEIKTEEGHLIRVVSYEERIHELEQDLEHKKIAIQNRNAKIKQLEAQVEKMKCCGNCNGILEGGRRAEKCRHCIDSKKLRDWEFAND